MNNVLYDVRGPVVDEAERMESSGVQILKLNIGNPAPFGFRTPDEVIYDMRQQLTECEGYSPAKGLFAARKAIMQYAQIKNIPNVTIEDIYTGNGVSELINLSMSALLDDGDEILIPSPDYPLWTACATLAGGKKPSIISATSRQTGILTLPTFEKDHAPHESDRHHQSQQSDRRALSEGSSGRNRGNRASAPSDHLFR